MFKNIKHMHFVGIGGIGMSGIAEVLNSMGYKITGSDVKPSQITERLEGHGIIVKIGHSEENVSNSDVVVYSSAVKMDNPEIVFALKERIPVIPRAEMLAELMRLKYSIAVAGTHGKTTTTSMVAKIFHTAGLDPTIIVGGQVKSMDDANACLGQGEYLVAEADESDKSFLKLFPTISIITNIDEDHLDNYKDIEDIKDNFVRFASNVPFYGAVVMCVDDQNTSDIIPLVKKRIITYGFSPRANIKAVDLEMNAFGSSFELVSMNMPLGRVTLNVPGKHNVLNSLGAIAVALNMEIPFDKICGGIGDFSGVKRRFETVYRDEKKDIYIIDDYAHHPAEITTVINSARNMGDYKIITVFQPHLYSRTYKLCSRFAEALSKSDITVITDIYPAREEPMPGVDGEMLVKEIKKMKGDGVFYVKDKLELPDFLKDYLKEKTLVLFVGAGDINKQSQLFSKEIG